MRYFLFEKRVIVEKKGELFVTTKNYPRLSLILIGSS